MNTGDIAQIEKAARAGGDVLRKYFGENLEQTTKGVLAATPVSINGPPGLRV